MGTRFSRFLDELYETNPNEREAELRRRLQDPEVSALDNAQHDLIVVRLSSGL